MHIALFVAPVHFYLELQFCSESLILSYYDRIECVMAIHSMKSPLLHIFLSFQIYYFRQVYLCLTIPGILPDVDMTPYVFLLSLFHNHMIFVFISQNMNFHFCVIYCRSANIIVERYFAKKSQLPGLAKELEMLR